MENSVHSAIEKRLDSIRKNLKSKDMDAVLVSKRENYLYMSGFTGSSALLIITQDDALLVTDFRYTEQAASQAPLYEIVMVTGSIFNTLNEILKRKGIYKLGFEDSYVTYAMYDDYKSKIEDRELVPLNGMIDDLRMVKDGEELKKIKKAVEITDNAFTHVLSSIKPGVTEIEIAAEIEYFMKRKGAKGPSFETIVASGKRASMPHGVASQKKVELGDVITLDFGCIYDEYCSDMTRTVFLGNPKNDIREIYGIVLKAQLEAIQGAYEGLTGKEIDAIARNVISQQGYEKNFGHGLGHSVGLEIHEEPRLSPSGNIKMQNGMVVTVEPGIYVSDLGGVRIEDMIVINNHDPLVLTGSTKEIIII